MRSISYLVIIALTFTPILSSCAARKSQNFYFGNYSEAERFYSKGEYKKAIEKYEAYREENPEGNLAVIAQYYMAKSHQALGEVDQAKALYETIVKEHPDLVWANFSQTQLKELSKAGTSAPAAA